MGYRDDRIRRIRNDLRSDYGVEIDAGSTEAYILADVSFLLAEIERLERAVEERDERIHENLIRIATDFRDTF